MQINGHDYTAFLEELSPVTNDLDSDGSGRNLLDGLMYRSRIAQKEKWTVKFLRIPEVIQKSLSEDLDAEYLSVTLLNPKTNRVMTKTYYTSTLNHGSQKYSKSDDCTVYDGCNFTITER